MFGNLILPGAGQGLLGGKQTSSQNFGQISINNKGQIIGQDMKQAFKMNSGGWNNQDSNMSALSTGLDFTNNGSIYGGVSQQESKKFDVLKVYENMDSINHQSILTGGIDIGLEIGQLTIDSKLSQG